MNQDNRWWTKPNSKAYESVFPYLKVLEKKQVYRTEENLRNLRLYGNVESLAFTNFAFYQAEPAASGLNRITLNIVQSMIDTVVSKITKNRPKVDFSTQGGDFSMQRKAQKLTKFVEGQFYACGFYDLATMGFKDSCIFGTGALKIFRDNGKIKVERVFIDELKMDENESIYGSPRQLHQKKLVHRDVLKQIFPKHAAKIDVAGQDMSSFYSNTQQDKDDMVSVVESWHLPSGPNSKDGKHIICIENETLLHEPYEKPYFPFVFLKWNTRPLGFWGQGLAEQLSGLQLEINKILRTIQVSMHLVSVPKILVEAGSKIVASHLNNKIGGIVTYSGTPPQYQALGQIPGELFSHLDRLYSRAFEIAGISQLSATSKKPSGLDSGKALRTYNDIESERFMEVALRYEQSFLDAARIMIDIAKEIAAEDGEFKVKTHGSKFFETIDWKDIDLDEDQYIMKMFPVSSLSSSPAGRLQEVQELLAAGFISKEAALKLLNFPDIEDFYRFENAGVEDIERTIEEIVDKGVYRTPEPYQNLRLGITKMQQAYLYYRTVNMPEERLELFRRWIEDADAVMQNAQAQLQQQQMEQQMAMQPPPPPEAALPPVDPATGLPIDAAALPVDPAAGLPPEQI